MQSHFTAPFFYTMWQTIVTKSWVGEIFHSLASGWTISFRLPYLFFAHIFSFPSSSFRFSSSFTPANIIFRLLYFPFFLFFILFQVLLFSHLLVISYRRIGNVVALPRRALHGCVKLVTAFSSPILSDYPSAPLRPLDPLQVGVCGKSEIARENKRGWKEVRKCESRRKREREEERKGYCGRARFSWRVTS